MEEGMWSSHGHHMFMSEEGTPTVFEWCPYYVRKIKIERSGKPDITYYIDPKDKRKLCLATGSTKEKKTWGSKEAVAGDE
jgi:hypothetical protein